ncbi:MAG: S8 family peptidase [Candidatus Eremiobacterota bacterium]
MVDLRKDCAALGLDVREVAGRRSVPVIVSLPDRRSAEKLSRHCQEELGLPVDELRLVNGFATELEAGDLKALRRSLPAGAVVALDRPFRFDPQVADPDEPGPQNPRPGSVFQPALPGIQAVHRKGYTGQGITVAVIDSGLYPHPDFKDRIQGWADFSNTRRQTPGDPKYGHGTMVAGILAGDGTRSEGAITGAAPEAGLVGVRIDPVPSQAIRAVQWVIENKDRLGIRVLNMSLGTAARQPASADLWAQVTQRAVDAGLVVVVAAGNEGPDPGTISTPGILPDAITVGAYDNRGTPETGDDRIYRFSSRGPTRPDGVEKPDVVAPGGTVYGALAPGSEKDRSELPRLGRDYVADSGTSQATPMIAGLVACLLQANPSLTPRDVKRILQESAARVVDGDANAQGAGLVDAERALALAKGPGL